MEPALRIEINDVGPARPLRRHTFRNPDPGGTGADGGVAMAGSLTPGGIVEACRQGMIPSARPEERGVWISPDPRAIIVPRNLHVSVGLEQTIRAGQVYVSLDAAFEKVLATCAEREEGSWITAEYQRAYLRLHQLGWAHSFEVWTVSGELAGGLYGLNVGGLFSIGSMFDGMPGASTVAVVAMARHLREVGVTLVDAREMTPDLAGLGAVPIARAEFVEWVGTISTRRVSFAGSPQDPDPVVSGSFAFISPLM